MLRRLLHITNRRNHRQCLQNRGSEPGRYGDMPIQCSRLPEHGLGWWMGPPGFRRVLDNLRVHSIKYTRDQQTSALFIGYCTPAHFDASNPTNDALLCALERQPSTLSPNYTKDFDKAPALQDGVEVFY